MILIIYENFLRTLVFLIDEQEGMPFSVARMGVTLCVVGGTLWIKQKLLYCIRLQLVSVIFTWFIEE